MSAAFAAAEGKLSEPVSAATAAAPKKTNSLNKKSKEALTAWEKHSGGVPFTDSLTDKKYDGVIVGDTSDKGGISITDLQLNDYMYDRFYHESREFRANFPRSLAVITLEPPQGGKRGAHKVAPLYLFSAAPRKFTEDHFFTNIDWLKENIDSSQNVRINFYEKVDGSVGRVFFFNHNGKLFMCVGSKKVTSLPYDFDDRETFIDQAKYTKKAAEIRDFLQKSLNPHNRRKYAFQATEILLGFFETLPSEKRGSLLDRLLSKGPHKDGDTLNTLVFETIVPGEENFIPIEKYGFSKGTGMISFLTITGDAPLPALTQDSPERTFTFFDTCGLPHPQILGSIDVPLSFFSPQTKEVEGIRKKVAIEIATCTHPAYREAMALNFCRPDSEGVIAFVSLPDGRTVSMKKEKTADYLMMRVTEKCARDVINGKINFDNSAASAVASGTDAVTCIREASTKLAQAFKELVDETTLEGSKLEVSAAYWEGLCKFLVDTVELKAQGKDSAGATMHEFDNFIGLRRAYDATLAKAGQMYPAAPSVDAAAVNLSVPATSACGVRPIWVRSSATSVHCAPKTGVCRRDQNGRLPVTPK